jgi:hypothetical protein
LVVQVACRMQSHSVSALHGENALVLRGARRHVNTSLIHSRTAGTISFQRQASTLPSEAKKPRADTTPDYCTCALHCPLKYLVLPVAGHQLASQPNSTQNSTRHVITRSSTTPYPPLRPAPAPYVYPLPWQGHADCMFVVRLRWTSKQS